MRTAGLGTINAVLPQTRPPAPSRSPIFKIFFPSFPSTKQRPIRPSPPLAHPLFLAPPRDNQIEEKVAGRRATNPVSATHFRIRLANSSVYNESLRSEEHTSELQSPVHLVCRLLLEKKKYR